MKIRVVAGTFSSAHFIPAHPKCGRIHGHSYSVSVVILGQPDASRMMIDFGIVKETMKSIVDQLDHRVILPSKDSSVKISQDRTSVRVDALAKRYIFPKEDTAIINTFSTTAEDLSMYLAFQLKSKIEWPSGVECIAVEVNEGPKQSACSDFLSVRNDRVATSGNPKLLFLRQCETDTFLSGSELIHED